MASRSYEGESDYASMRALLRRVYRDNGPPVYASVGDLDWWRSAMEPSDRLDVRLWFAGSELVGIAWPTAGQVDLLVDPAHDDVEDDMLEWAEEHVKGPRLRTWCYAGHASRRARLERRGYVRLPGALQYRTRVIGASLPSVELAEGYAVRNISGADEIEARVEVHRDAFAPSRMTTTRYRVAMSMPTYRTDLDLVAVAPDGSFAAFCIVWWDEESRLGTFEPVGCHSAHRRRGLAGSVMVEGLHRLRALGAVEATVATNAGSVPAEQLYESLGFPVVDVNLGYERTT